MRPDTRATSTLLALLCATACDPSSLAPPLAPDLDAGDPDAADDDAAAPDAGEDAFDPGPEVGPGGWRFVPIAGMRCGSGASTGLGLAPGPRRDQLFVVLMGGGACWDVNSCFVLRAAANLEEGYDASQFARDAVGLAAAPLLNREDPENPFRDATFVFIPYCTGDMHAGTRVTRYEALGATRDIHHVGARNLDAALAHLGDEGLGASQVWLYGLSAGGYGAAFNWTRVADAFPDARVDALSDCGVPVTPPDGRYRQWVAAWAPALPAGCEACQTRLERVLLHQLEADPPGRYAQLAYTDDQVLSAYYGLGPGGLRPLVLGLAADLEDHPGSAASFILSGSAHVMAADVTRIAADDGTPLLDWVRAWGRSTTPWASHGP
jgi:hypothetical protein